MGNSFTLGLEEESGLSSLLSRVSADDPCKDTWFPLGPEISDIGEESLELMLWGQAGWVHTHAGELKQREKTCELDGRKSSGLRT